MSRLNRSRTVAFTLTAGLGLTFKSAVHAAAPKFPDPVSNGCAGNSGTLRYRFSTVQNETFTGTEQAAINARIALWNAAKAPNGVAFNDVQQAQSAAPGSGVWTIRQAGVGWGGDADCGTRSISVHVFNFGLGQANVAAHEVGHAIGLAHDGDDDVIYNSGTANGSGPSLMSTCIGDFSAANISADDRGQVSYRRGAGTVANSGFEDGLADWQVIQGNVSEQTAAPASGSKYRRLDPGGTIYAQRTRVEVNRTSYAVTFRYKGNGPGQAAFKFSTRSVKFSTGAAVLCSWQNNLDYNSSSLIDTAYTYRGGVALNGAANWTLVGTPVGAIPAYDSGGNPGAQDVEAAFYTKNLASYLFVDDVRVS